MIEYLQNVKKQLEEGTLDVKKNSDVFNNVIDELYNESFYCECCKKTLKSRNRLKHEHSKGHLLKLSK